MRRIQGSDWYSETQPNMQVLNSGLVVAEQRLCTEILLRVMEMSDSVPCCCKQQLWEFCTREGLGTALNSYGFLLRSSVVCSRNRIQYVVTCYANTEPRLTSVQTQKSHSNQLFIFIHLFCYQSQMLSSSLHPRWTRNHYSSVLYWLQVRSDNQCYSLHHHLYNGSKSFVLLQAVFRLELLKNQPNKVLGKVSEILMV